MAVARGKPHRAVSFGPAPSSAMRPAPKRPPRSGPPHAADFPPNVHDVALGSPVQVHGGAHCGGSACQYTCLDDVADSAVFPQSWSPDPGWDPLLGRVSSSVRGRIEYGVTTLDGVDADDGTRARAQIRNAPHHRFSRPRTRTCRGAAGSSYKSSCATSGRALRRRVRKAGSDPSDQLHRIRIGAKRLRYAAEMAEPLIGRTGHRIARRAEEVQDVLGRHHDAVAVEGWLRARIFSRSPESGDELSVAAAFSAGSLAAVEQRAQRKFRRRRTRSW